MTFRTVRSDVAPLQNNLGTITTNTTIDVSQTPEVKFTLGADLTLSFQSWAATGYRQEIELEIVNGGAHTITWPVVNWLKGDGTSSTTFSSMTVSLQASGTNFVLIWTTDNGTTLWGTAA